MALDFLWQHGERVMFIGDVTTEDPLGYTRLVPAMVTARYPERNIDFFPRGVGGNRIGDLVMRLDRDVLDLRTPPTWIIVDVGLNDWWDGTTGTPLGRFRELYLELLLRLRNTKATIACLTTTVHGEDLHNRENQDLVGYNEAIRAIAFEQGMQVIDINASFLDALQRVQAVNPDFRYTVDGVRLNVYGNYLFALTLLRALYFTP